MNQIQDENFENIQSKNGDSGLKTEQGNNKKDMEIEEGEVHSQTDDKPKKGSNKVYI